MHDSNVKIKKTVKQFSMQNLSSRPSQQNNSPFTMAHPFNRHPPNQLAFKWHCWLMWSIGWQDWQTPPPFQRTHLCLKWHASILHCRRYGIGFEKYIFSQKRSCNVSFILFLVQGGSLSHKLDAGEKDSASAVAIKVICSDRNGHREFSWRCEGTWCCDSFKFLFLTPALTC